MKRHILRFFLLAVIVDLAVWSLVTKDRAATAVLCAMTAGYYYLRHTGFGG